MNDGPKDPFPAPGIDYRQLAENIKRWAVELGFQAAAITDVDLSEHEPGFLEWLELGFHGEMGYMARHGLKRCRPAELEPGTRRIISLRMDYLPSKAEEPWSVLENSRLAYISRYALGRDYHKLMRKRLQQLARKIETVVGAFGYRAFVDSAPVLEKPIAEKAGLGWLGKHTNVISRDAGSWFFLGELFTDLPLPRDPPTTDNHCGDCVACIDICPTRAIVAPGKLDARRCISYLTIEYRGVIPLELRPLIGNRIYGCDDCQLVCPWNRFARYSVEADFQPRHGLDAAALTTLFRWTEAEFLERLQGSPIRRIGHECWRRNIAVAMGNAEPDAEIVELLANARDAASEMLREHIDWALARQQTRRGG
ncbi:MAG TPA: tRNA epoxyqueuosine(34) reductase QueG [Gammaproteobacteria bacterium]|nr:tRNA epoxyqueuosine(34) reductase QueG [Gammaproteobacteria bacterium]